MKFSRAAVIAASLLMPLAAHARDIDVIISLSGPGSFLGLAEQQALELQEKQINAAGGVHGKPVNFVFHDDQSSPQLSVQLAAQVKQSSPPVVFGSTLVASCNAMAPLLRGGPLQYCFSAGVHPAAGANMFTAGVSTTDAAHALLTYFKGRGWTRIALLTSTDATGQDADKSFDELLTLPDLAGVSIVQKVHFNTSDVSIAAQIERMRQATPQAIIGWTTGSSFATILRELVNAGVALPIGTTPGNMTLAQIKQIAAFAPKQLYSGAPQWPLGDDPKYAISAAVTAKQKEFYAAYAAIGRKPDEGSVLGWDPGTIIIDALQKLPENVTGDQLRAYMAKLTDAPGASGDYDFVTTPQRGLSIKNTLVTQWNVAGEKWDVVSQPAGIPLDEK